MKRWVSERMRVGAAGVWLALALSGTWSLAPGLAGAAPLPGPDSALAVEDVDVGACRTVANGTGTAVNADAMLYSLGLAPLPPGRLPYQLAWSAGSSPADAAEGVTFQYLVVFRRPVTVGSVLCTTAEVACLKPGLEGAPDPAVAEQWAPIPIPAAQGGVRLAVPEKPVTTRALLFTDRLKWGRSVLAPGRILKGHWFNVAHEAAARAKTEYTSGPLAGSHTAAAMNVVVGRGPWQSNGKNDQGNIVGPFVSDVEPTWFMLAWDEPRPLTGIYLRDNFGKFVLQEFAGPAGIDPVAGVESEWKTVSPQRYTVAEHYGRWLLFREPLTTRALRFLVTQALGDRQQDSQVAEISALLAVVELGGAPPPPVRPPGAGAPPFAIPYELPRAGYFTLAVDDAKGIRMRNLVAREERGAGAGREFWDLRDERGEYVAPGTYRWKAITHPGLGLRYQMTPYPNVAVHHADRTPWLNEREGAGGWLADHAPPYGACTLGDLVFLNAPTCESGVGFIACDLSGRKQWAISAFDSWTSGQRICTDGTTVFVEQMGWGAYGAADEGADRIWAVDPATRTSRKLLSLRDDARRKRGIAGFAARAGKVYAAINATPNWLANPAGMEVVDIARCLPFYKEPRPPKRPYEIVPDPRDDFFRLWRLKGTPPGCYALTYLESTRGPERRQHIVLAFKEPVALGGAVLPVPQAAPYKVTLSVLKPDAPWPCSPDDRRQWQDFEQQPQRPWDVALAPPDTRTRAVRITFTQAGAGDDIDDILEEGGAGAAADHDEPELDLRREEAATDERAWFGQIEGIKLLRWRFRNRFDTAAIRVSSGTVDAASGAWDAQRQEPVSPEHPGIYVLQWPEPVALRGLAVMEIDGRRMEVDAWSGADAPTAIDGAAGWEKVGDYTQRLRDFHSGFVSANMNARYLDGYVDFGREVKTRALRLRIVEQWTGSLGDLGPNRPDRGGQDLNPAGCRIFGVAPVQYVGGEPPVDNLVFQRIERIDGATGAVEAETPIEKPGPLVFAPDGTLYGVSAGRLVKVDLAEGRHQPLDLDVRKPQALASDAQGNLYVFDAAPDRQLIRVFDAQGKLVRDIGEPGGYRAGAWNPRRLSNITGLAVDRLNQVWAVSHDYWPKRVALWQADGTYLREYLGPTAYGGGGVLDPGDRRRLFYGPLEFEIDWASGASRLKNLTWTGASETGKMFMGSAAGEVPIRLNGRQYLVTRPEFVNQHCAMVYLYREDGSARLAAAVGKADFFPPLKDPAILRALAPKVLPQLQFTWSDRNGDGLVQFAEVTFADLHIRGLTMFDRQLNIQAGAYAFEVQEFLPDGVPVYAEKKYPLPVTARYGDGAVYRLANGTFYRFGGDERIPDAGLAADGTVLWTYRNEGAGVGPDRSCGPYHPAQVVCQFGVVGHETAAGGDLGEFFVVNANLGSWNVWTADGLLAGRIFRDLRDPRRIPWSMKEHERHMVLDDVALFQEHFSGWFCRADDGKYYVVAGHHQANVAEVVGLDDFRRLSGTLTVTGEDVARAQEWEREAARARAKGQVRVLDAYPAAGKTVIDGSLEEWGDGALATLPRHQASFRLAYDADTLYLAWEVWYQGPFRNSGREWDRKFKTGACVDLMLGTDEAADPRRQAPLAGDKRLLLTPDADGRVLAVLYDAVVPGTPADQRWTVSSPVGRCTFDAVRQLPDVRATWKPLFRVAVDKEPSGYLVEAAVPLQTLGLEIVEGRRLRFDWGILETDADGNVVLARRYWANQATSTLADLPTEAMLQPDLWGYLRLHTRAKDKFTATGLLESDRDRETEGWNLEEP